jgi:hypothetical protein
MIHPLRLRHFAILASCLVAGSTAFAQPATPMRSPGQLYEWLGIRKERVALLRTEVHEQDAHIESRLDLLVESLTKITDSKDSRTKVARMKEDTGQKLMRTVEYYEQKRAALQEDLRNPRTSLTVAEKQQAIAGFDARINKRIDQVVALTKSMPAHRDYQRYKATGGGWWGTQYERNQDYEQNRRMTSHSNQQREALTKQLDTSLARLDRHLRDLRSQAPAGAEQQKLLKDEVARTNAMIAERRRQKADLYNQSDTAARGVSLKQATDLDRTMQQEIEYLRRDMTTLFQRYNELIGELSFQHATEAALAQTGAR